MANPKTKIIEQDGKRYEFTPGKHGSTVVRMNRVRNELTLPNVKPGLGKAVPMNPAMKVKPFPTSATRG